LCFIFYKLFNKKNLWRNHFCNNITETAAEYSLLSSGLRSVNNIKEPYQRMVRVLQWLLLRSYFVPQKGFEQSKPYNPILGEIFECEFAHSDSKTTAFVEQVSHHPPISSLFTYNETHNIMYESTMRIASTFRVRCFFITFLMSVFFYLNFLVLQTQINTKLL